MKFNSRLLCSVLSRRYKSENDVSAGEIVGHTAEQKDAISLTDKLVLPVCFYEIFQKSLLVPEYLVLDYKSIRSGWKRPQLIGWTKAQLISSCWLGAKRKNSVHPNTAALCPIFFSLMMMTWSFIWIIAKSWTRYFNVGIHRKGMHALRVTD